jgi:glycerol kinase
MFYVMAIDQGTTGTTALILDAELNVIATSTRDFAQHFPRPSWVEHDLNEIWESVCGAVKGVLEKAGLSGSRIKTIGITNQRETTCVWRKEPSAPPLARAIVWQDRRTASYCEDLKKKNLERRLNRMTGLLLDPYFSATKMAWLLRNADGVGCAIKSGAAVFGTIDSYLLYRMTGGVHGTDVTNASRTLLMDLKTCQWDDELLDIFGVPRKALPEIFASCIEYGKTKNFAGLPDGIPITGIAGDQQAALFGQACFERGMGKCTYGTGAFVLVNTGSRPVFSRHRLLTTVAWKTGETTTYGIEGSAFIAGAAVQWFRDGLGLIPASDAIEELAASVPGSDGVVFVPALSGLGAPHWLPMATGLFTGITRGTTKAHMARALLEGIAFQVANLIEAMNKDLAKRISSMRVDGGASANNLLMQFQADILGVKIVRSQIKETTALGAALMAGIGVGIWKGLDEVARKWKAAAEFKASLSPSKRKLEMKRWADAIAAAKFLAQRK